jgi:hypothetical protein
MPCPRLFMPALMFVHARPPLFVHGYPHLCCGPLFVQALPLFMNPLVCARLAVQPVVLL